jgi:hypothetical protein
MLLAREITMYCLQFRITTDEVDRLETMVNKWVLEYEK